MECAELERSKGFEKCIFDYLYCFLLRLLPRLAATRAAIQAAVVLLRQLAANPHAAEKRPFPVR
jgi:hypothetical protein